MAQEGKERGDGEGFITVAKDFKVYRVFVVKVREERDCRVDGDHKENANDA